METVSQEELNQLIQREIHLTKEDYLNYYQDIIQSIPSFALGPYYWMIPNQQTVQIMVCSENMGELTPYSSQEWEGKDLYFWFSIIHPEDRDFVSSSMAKFLQIHMTLDKAQGNQVFANISLRMQNKEGQYRWVLLQFPKWMYNEEQVITGTLILVSDLSLLSMNIEKVFTVINYSNGSQIFVSRQMEDPSQQKILLELTRREMQILQLMTQGMNTPQIAEQLCISYNTVENHKSNLRKKTGSKTSAQLINFLWKNNLV